MNNLTVTTAIEHFPEKELACKGTGIILLDARFAVALVSLRNEWNKPLIPNSVCRTPEHNKNEGGHPTSLHLTENPKHPTNGTMAADIRWANWTLARKIEFARFCWKRGWSIGLHNSFIHIDRRIDVGMKQRVFLYGAWNNEFGAKEIME